MWRDKYLRRYSPGKICFLVVLGEYKYEKKSIRGSKTNIINHSWNNLDDSRSMFYDYVPEKIG